MTTGTTSNLPLEQQFEDERKKHLQDAAERRKRPLVFKGVDLQVEINRMQRALEHYRTYPYKPIIQIRHSACEYGGGRGSSRRVVVTLGRKTSAARALELLLHELCHSALPGNVNHGELFVSLMVRVSRELWGIEISGWSCMKRGIYGNRAYAVDEQICCELQQRIDSGQYVPAAAARPPAPRTVVERMVDLKARREEHARRMLGKHQKRLAQEQKLVRKWRNKVGYYERMAARRES